MEGRDTATILQSYSTSDGGFLPQADQDCLIVKQERRTPMQLKSKIKASGRFFGY
jgi:hypothetical protein